MKNSKQLYFDMPDKTALGIEDYIITESNSFAFDLISRMIKGEINQGVISGPSFSGKTHLSKILIKNIGINESLYIDRDYKNIIERVGSSNLIVIENIDKVIEDRSEEDLFHIINFTKENDKKLLMTSCKSISNIEFKLEDLKSRLNAILEAKIMQPDDELMKLVLIKIFNDKQLLINPNVINFLKSRLERSYKSINDFIEKIDKFSLERGKKITIALINDLIK
jgi:chromosomal replication initiation ATPase DnaA